MNTQSDLAFQEQAGSGIMPEVINHQVDARGVHGALEVKTRFDDWFRARVLEFGFVEGEDYSLKFQENPTAGGRPRKDYLVTLDMAKELAMVERNEAGRKMRRYFIECEKRLITGCAPAPAALPNSTLLRLQEINAGVIQELGHHQARIEKLEASARPGPDWLSPADWLESRGIVISQGRTCVMSQKCTARSGAMNLPVGRERGENWRDRRTYAPEVIEHVAGILLARWKAADELKGGKS
jgi:phage anti-repressor protein